MRFTARRNCSQGAVLPPLCWVLLMDELTTTLSGYDVEMSTSNSDLVSVIKARSDPKISQLLQTVLIIIYNWCRGMPINHQKKMCFVLRPLSMNDVQIAFVTKLNILELPLNEYRIKKTRFATYGSVV